MPNGNNPNCLPLRSIEEAIRLQHHLSKGKIGKLWDEPARLRKPEQSSEHVLGTIAELQRRLSIISLNVGDCRKKLKTS